MPKVKYNVSLRFRGSKDPVQDFTAQVQEWGGTGQTLFPERQLHLGGDPQPLLIELDRIKPPAIGTAKLTLTGPATGEAGDPVTYETNLALRRWTGGDIVLWFAKCPKIDQPTVAAPASTPRAPLPPVPGLDKVFAEIFSARDAAQKGIDGARDKLLEMSERNGLDLSLLSDDWYGRQDLDCATINIHIDDAGAPANLDATAQLRYYGADYPLNDPKKVSHDYKRPTVIHARAKNGKAKLDIMESGGVGRHFITEIDLGVGDTHNVVVVPRPCAPPVAVWTKRVPVKLSGYNNIIHYMPRKHIANSAASRAKSLQAVKIGLNWLQNNHPNAVQSRVLAFYDETKDSYFLASDRGNYMWGTFIWEGDSLLDQGLITEDRRITHVYVEWTE